MATISEVRAALEAKGRVWDAELYDKVVAKYGKTITVDQPRPGLSSAAPAPIDASRWAGGLGSLIGPATMNLGTSALGGATAGLSSKAMPTHEYETGTGFGNFIANEAAPVIGGAAGTMLSLANIPGLPIRLAGTGIGIKAINKVAPLAHRLGVYGAASGGIAAAQEGGAAGDIAKGAIHEGVKQGALGIPLSFVPGGSSTLAHIGKDFGLGYGMATVGGSDVKDALLEGAGFAVAGRALGAQGPSRKPLVDLTGGAKDKAASIEAQKARVEASVEQTKAEKIAAVKAKRAENLAEAARKAEAERVAAEQDAAQKAAQVEADRIARITGYRTRKAALDMRTTQPLVGAVGPEPPVTETPAPPERGAPVEKPKRMARQAAATVDVAALVEDPAPSALPWAKANQNKAFDADMRRAAKLARKTLAGSESGIVEELAAKRVEEMDAWRGFGTRGRGGGKGQMPYRQRDMGPAAARPLGMHRDAVLEAWGRAYGESARDDLGARIEQRAKEISAQRDVSGQSLDDVTLGAGLGPLQGAFKGFKIESNLPNKAERKTLADAKAREGEQRYGTAPANGLVPVDVANKAYIDNKDLVGHAAAASRSGQIAPDVEAAYRDLAKTRGDAPHGKGSEWQDQMGTLQEHAGGKPGTATDRDLTHVMIGTQQARLEKVADERNRLVNRMRELKIKPGKKIDQLATKIAEQISSFDANDGFQFVASRAKVQAAIAESGASPAEAEKAIKFAIEARQNFDRWRDEVNAVRSSMGLKLIPRVENYVSWLRSSAFSDMMQETRAPMGGGDVPDFIHGSEVFNPRAQHRGLEEKFIREMSLSKLMGAYIDISAKDMFFSPAVRHYRARSALFRELEMPNRAADIDLLVDHSFGLKPRTMTKMFQAMPPIAKRVVIDAPLQAYKNYAGNVFSVNPKFNLYTQIGGLAIVPAKYGLKATAKGLALAADPQFRAAMRKNAPMRQMKTMMEGRIGLADIEGIGSDSKSRMKAGMRWLTDRVEDLTDNVGGGAAYAKGQELGLRGRDLWEFASDGIQKTAGYYGREIRPSFIAAKEMPLVQPFMNMVFQMGNNFREIGAGKYVPGLQGAVGKYGYSEIPKMGAGGGEVTPRVEFARRAGTVLRFAVVLGAVNAMVGKGREQYGIRGFVPGLSLATGGAIGGLGAGGTGKEGQAFYQRLVGEGVSAAKTFMETGDYRPLRKYALLYLNSFGGGLAAERMIETVEAYSNGGRVEGKPDKETGRRPTLFTMEEDEILQSILFGPYETRSGREYLAKIRGEKKSK